MAFAEIMTFMLVAALLVMSPGPNGVLIAKTLPTSGRTAAFANIGGFVTAFFLHGALSIFGISILLVKSSEAFFIFKMAGALYLGYIGIKALVEAWQNKTPVQKISPAKRKRTLAVAFGEGFLTNALNPKVSMFYLAAFPQFMPSGEAAIGGAFLLVILHSVINVIWFGGLILLFGKLGQAARSAKFTRGLKAFTGMIFIGFGAKLALLRP